MTSSKRNSTYSASKPASSHNYLYFTLINDITGLQTKLLDEEMGRMEGVVHSGQDAVEKIFPTEEMLVEILNQQVTLTKIADKTTSELVRIADGMLNVQGKMVPDE